MKDRLLLLKYLDILCGIGHNRFIVKRILLILSLFLFVVGVCGLADEESGTESLKIKPKAELYTADYHIQGDIDPKEDKERTRFGIGEKFTLTLTGKPMGNQEELQWKIEEGKNLIEAIDEDDLKGKTSIKLTAKKDLKKDDLGEGTVKISLKTSDENISPDPLTITIVLPDSLKAVHRGGGQPVPVIDANNSIPGAPGLFPSAILDMTLLPTNVSFKGMKIIERDKGSDPQGCTLDPGHKGNGVDKPIEIEEKNDFYDEVGGGLFYRGIIDGTTVLPQTWSWKCSWKVHTGEGGPDSEGEDTVTFAEKDQTFNYQYILNEHQEVDGVHGTITKFGRSVSRRTGDTANTYQ